MAISEYLSTHKVSHKFSQQHYLQASATSRVTWDMALPLVSCKALKAFIKPFEAQ